MEDQKHVPPMDEIDAEYRAWAEEDYKKKEKLLDHFAGLAMQAMMSSDQYDLSVDELVHHAYKKAMAMINEREAWIDEL